MTFDIDRFNYNMKGRVILYRLVLVKISCRCRPWQLVYIRLGLPLRRIPFLATQYIYVFQRILKSNSDNFHVSYSSTGLSDGNAVSSAGYELMLYMNM